MISTFYWVLIVLSFLIVFGIIGLVLLKRRKDRKLRLKTPEQVTTPLELITDLCNYQISDRKPMKLFHPDTNYIQVVLIGKIIGMKSFWAEYDGIGLIRTKNRAYRIPKDNVYGDVFLYDVDKKQCINELIKVEKSDAEDSFHILQVFNMAYSVGRQAGATDLLNKLGIVTIILIVLVVGEIAIAYFMYKGFGNIAVQLTNAQNIIDTYIKAHPGAFTP